MRALQVIAGVVFGLLGAGLLYFCNRVSFYSYRIDAPTSGGTYRNPVVMAIAGIACVAVAIVLVAKGCK